VQFKKTFVVDATSPDLAGAFFAPAFFSDEENLD
jgi:hypothetical protein